MKLNQLDINELYYFIRIAQAGSISEAARVLGIPKSKLSRKLSMLEKKMGVTLAKRLTRSLALTEEGRRLVQRTEGHFASIMGELDNISAPQSLLSGEFKIAAPMGFGSTSFMKLLGEFRKLYPGIQIQFDMLGRTQNVLKADYDVYFHAGSGVPESAVAIRLAEFDLQIFASAKYLNEHGMPQSLEELSQHDCLSLTNLRQSHEWDLVSRQTKEKKVLTVKPVLICNQPHALKNALLDHQGIGLMSSVLVKAEVEEGDLVPILPEWHLPGLGLYMVYLKQKVRNPKVKAFTSFMKAEYAKFWSLEKEKGPS